MAAVAERLGTSIGFHSQLPDEDPAETQEWLESLDGLVDHAGRPQALALLLGVLRLRPPQCQQMVEHLNDAAYAFELGQIVRDGLRRMYGHPCPGEDPNVFYYLTLYNEPIAQPAEPDDVDADWMRAVPDQTASFVSGSWSSLGTDGFGRSHTRPALRRHFGVDAPSIVLRTLEQLIARHEMDSSVRNKAIEAYGLDAAGDPTTGSREDSAR